MVENPADADPLVPANKPRRRRWLLFGVCLLFVVVAAVAAAWLCAAKTYTASALIRIASDEPMVIPNGGTRTRFDIYKATQMQLLTSDFVLIGALRTLPNLAVLTREEDPVRWLAKSIQIDCPGNAEIVRVSLATPQKDDAVAIVQAVVETYMKEVADKERTLSTKRLSELDMIYTEKDTELRIKWAELNKLSEQLGSGGQIENQMQPQITVLAQLAAESRRAEMQAELRIAHFKHDMSGLDKESAKFKTANAEADLAEVDREFWNIKSAKLNEEVEKIQNRLDRQSTVSIDVEMMRPELESLKAIARALNDERQRVQVELNSQPRIAVIQRAL